MEVYFNITIPDEKSRKFKLSDNEFVIIGRSSAKCQVVLDYSQCSSKHCIITLKDGQVHVEDLNSKNGIFLNGVRILKQRVYADDKIEIGKIVISVDKAKLDKDKFTGLFNKGTLIRDAGNLTLKLAAKINITKRMSHKRIITPQITSDKKKAYLESRKSDKRRMSKSKRKILEYFAFLIDLAISFAFFYLIVNIIRNNLPSETEIDPTRGFMNLVFSGDIQYQVIISIFLSIVILGINRNLPKGSIGEQLFKLN